MSAFRPLSPESRHSVSGRQDETRHGTPGWRRLEPIRGRSGPNWQTKNDPRHGYPDQVHRKRATLLLHGGRQRPLLDYPAGLRSSKLFPHGGQQRPTNGLFSSISEPGSRSTKSRSPSRSCFAAPPADAMHAVDLVGQHESPGAIRSMVAAMARPKRPAGDFQTSSSRTSDGTNSIGQAREGLCRICGPLARITLRRPGGRASRYHLYRPCVAPTVPAGGRAASNDDRNSRRGRGKARVESEWESAAAGWDVAHGCRPVIPGVLRGCEVPRPGP